MLPPSHLIPLFTQQRPHYQHSYCELKFVTASTYPPPQDYAFNSPAINSRPFAISNLPPQIPRPRDPDAVPNFDSPSPESEYPSPSEEIMAHSYEHYFEQHSPEFPSSAEELPQPVPPTHQELFEFPEEHHRYRLHKPWWIWTICGVDIVLGLLLSFRMISNLVTSTRDPFGQADRDIAGSAGWAVVFVVFSFIVQFIVGSTLFVGLRNPDDDQILWYLQCWNYGAYVLFVMHGFILISVLGTLKSQGPSAVAASFPLVVILLSFRFGSFFLVRRFRENCIWGKSHGRNFPTPPPVRI